MPHEVKPHTSFLRPQNIYFSLFALLAIHVLTLIGEMPASVQCVINSLACLYIGAMSTSKIRFNKCISNAWFTSHQSTWKREKLKWWANDLKRCVVVPNLPLGLPFWPLFASETPRWSPAQVSDYHLFFINWSCLSNGHHWRRYRKLHAG